MIVRLNPEVPDATSWQELQKTGGSASDLTGLRGPLFGVDELDALTAAVGGPVFAQQPPQQPAVPQSPVQEPPQGQTQAPQEPGQESPPQGQTQEPQESPTQPPPQGQTEPGAQGQGDELDEVKVTGTRRVRPEQRETVTRYQIEKDAIEATGATTVSDALRKLAPGFFSTDSLGGIDTERGTFLRGLDSRRFLVLVDGRPTTRPGNNRSLDLGRVGVTNVDRIEVITGGAGLRYSADAVGGAINIITRVPQGPTQVRLRTEQGSYGFSRYAVNVTGSNELSPSTPGFLGYEFNFERRSGYNNYFGTYYQEPVGLGIQLGGAGAQTAVSPDAPFVDNPSLGRLYQVPVSFPKPLRSGYVFSDDYLGKLVYQPGTDHTLTLSFLSFASRIGDQFAAPNLEPRCRIVPENYGISLELFPNEIGLPPIGDPEVERRTYTRCDADLTDSVATQNLRGRGDQALDEATVALNWDWKLSDTSRLNLLGSWGSAFADNPSSPGTRLVSSNLIDGQLNYSSEFSTVNTFRAGFQFTEARYSATPVIGAGGNQQPLTSFNQFFQPLPTPVTSDFFAVNTTKSSWSLYFTDQWRFFEDAVIVDLGTRLTTDSLFGTFTTPGAGARWNIGPRNQEVIALRANWFESFKAPGLSQLFGYGGYSFTQVSGGPFGGPVEYLRNVQLKPETGISYDFGLDLRLSPTALLRATYFRTELSNGIVENVPIALQPLQILGELPDGRIGPITNPLYNGQESQLKFDNCFNVGQVPFVNGVSGCSNLITNINAQSYLSTGWELSFDWKLTPQLQLFASHAIVDARPTGNALRNTFPDDTTGIDLPLGSGGIQGGYFYNYQSFDVPFNTTNLIFRYGSPTGPRVALVGQFVGLRPRPDGGPNYYQPYNRWDFTFGLPLFGGVTLTGGVFNLFNDRSVLADGTLALGGGVLSPPTTFRVGMEAGF